MHSCLTIPLFWPAFLPQFPEYIVQNLQKYNYSYVVIDAGWFDALNGSNLVDSYGRWVPNPTT